MVDVRHHRQAELVRDFDRHVERRHAARPARAAADAHLDSDDEIAVLARHPHALVEIEQAQVPTLRRPSRYG
jgi:hypothetical protein